MFLKINLIFLATTKMDTSITSGEFKDESVDEEVSGSSPSCDVQSSLAVTNVEDVDDTTQENKMDVTDDEISKTSDATDEKQTHDFHKICEQDSRDIDSPNKGEMEEDAKSESEPDKRDTSNSDQFEFRDEDSEANDEPVKDQVILA